MNMNVASERPELGAAERYRLLAAEADHRLLNNLQSIASLLALHRRQCRSADSIAPLVSITQRVMALQRIHRALRSTEQISAVEVKALFSELSSDYAAAFGVEKGPGFSIAAVGDEIQLPTGQASSLATAGNELLMNAIKHGEGSIRVELEKSGTRYKLSVSSEGGQLPPDFDINRSKGLGMGIIKALVQKLKGSFDVEIGPEGVPVFSITVPIGHDA